MARFEFKLEALLTVRRQLEEAKQRRMGVIQQEMQVIMRGIQETEQRIAAENRRLGNEGLTGKLDMQYISLEKRFVGNLYVKIVLAMQKLRELERVLAGARAELLAAARARKVIEKLRERDVARWRAELERKEAAVMDEIGTQLAMRNGNAM